MDHWLGNGNQDVFFDDDRLLDDCKHRYIVNIVDLFNLPRELGQGTANCDIYLFESDFSTAGKSEDSKVLTERINDPRRGKPSRAILVAIFRKPG